MTATVTRRVLTMRGAVGKRPGARTRRTNMNDRDTRQPNFSQEADRTVRVRP